MNTSLAANSSFHRQRGSRTSRTKMGVRMRLHDGEPIGQALKRFNRLVDEHQQRHQRHKQIPWRLIRYPCYIKPSEVRSYKKRVKLLKARLEEYRRAHRPGPVVFIYL